MSIKKLIGISVICLLPSAIKAYTSVATLTFPAASGATTDTNITLAFSASDAKLKTTANGGEIYNTVTRVGVVVPTDLILTSDATCATQAGGYTWGIETYSAAAGTLNGWVMVPSLTTGASVSITVCIGNAAISTYQGGAAGAEFDTYTQVAYHFPNGTTASYLDFSANANNATNTLTTAVAGKLDGAVGFVSASTQYVATPLSNLSYTNGTVSLWAYPGTAYNDGSDMFLFGQSSAGEFSFQKYSDGNFYAGWSVSGDHRVVVASTALTWPQNTWVRYDLTWTSTGTTTLYANGVSIGTHTGTVVASIPTPLTIGQELANGGFFTGRIDEFRISNALRSADWINTEYANQSSAPAIGAFSPSQPAITFSGCPTTQSLGGGASSACTVSISPGNFPSTCYLSDSTTGNGWLNGGTFTPSLGSPGTSVVGVPCTGASSFTFTYTPALIGSFILTLQPMTGVTITAPSNDVVTKVTPVAYTGSSGYNVWNSAASWGAVGIPASGDSATVPANSTIHITGGYTAVIGSCPGSATNADLIIANEGAVIADPGSTIHLQGNPQMAGASNTTAYPPIFQISNGATIIQDTCNGTVNTGPFGTNSNGYNFITAGVDTSDVDTLGTAITWKSGRQFTVTSTPFASNIGGAAVTINSCASATSCTASASLGTHSGYVMLTAEANSQVWPNAAGATPSIWSSTNNTGANGVIDNPNSTYSSVSLVLFGLKADHCGSASVSCAPVYLLNNLGGSILEDRSDIEYSTFNFTGGEAPAGQMAVASTYFKRFNVQYSNSLGSVSISPYMASGAYTGGTVCDMEEFYSDVGIGRNDVANGCTLTNYVLGNQLIFGGTIASTYKWASATNFIIIDNGLPAFVASWGGSASNFLLESSAANDKMSGALSNGVNLTFANGIFEADYAVAEAHCFEDLNTTSGYTPSITITGFLALPSPVTGVQACTGAISVGTSSATSVKSIANSTFVSTGSGVASVGAGGYWDCHPPTVSLCPTNQALVSYTGNINYQEAAPDSTNSYSVGVNSAAIADYQSTVTANTVKASGIDYNGLYKMATSSSFASGNSGCNPSTTNGTAVNECNSTGTVDSHSITSNPDFVQTTRNINTWATSQGYPGSAGSGVLALFLANNPASYPSLITGALTWIRYGFRPTNPTYATASSTTGPLGCCGFGAVSGGAMTGIQ